MENCHFSNTVPNTVFFEIFIMFDSIKLITHHIFFNKIKITVVRFYSAKKLLKIRIRFAKLKD